MSRNLSIECRSEFNRDSESVRDSRPRLGRRSVFAELLLLATLNVTALLFDCAPMAFGLVEIHSLCSYPPPIQIRELGAASLAGSLPQCAAHCSFLSTGAWRIAHASDSRLSSESGALSLASKELDAAPARKFQ